MHVIIRHSLLFIGLILLYSCHQKTENIVTIDSILAQISEPVIAGNTFNILDFEAQPDSVTNCKPAIDKAIATVKEQGGGKLVFPAGNYYVDGPIHLTSNLELHLEAGATIRFGSNPTNYLPVVKTSWEGTFLYNYSPFIYAYQCSNIILSGEGTIDGEASETWQLWRNQQANSQQLSRKMNHESTPIEQRIFGEGHFLRPHLVQFFDCKNIKIEGIKVEDSPFWCIHLLRCENVIIRKIRFEAFNKNNDGIDPEYSRNVLIEGVHFNNGDDNVAIKAGRDHEGRASKAGSENIIIRNCRFQGLHAVVIGSEMSAGVQNVFVEDCTFAGKLKRGIYLKSNPDRGGYIRNLYVKNVEFDEVEDCIYITSYYHNEGAGYATEIKDIFIENVTCRLATGTGIVIQGFPEKKVTDVFLKSIRIVGANNALSMENTENIVMSDVVIGKMATAPTAVH
jgi:polygalacturonase